MRHVLLSMLVIVLTLAASAQAHDPLVRINYVALEKLGWKLGSQAYTFRSLTLIETLDTLHRLDLRYIEMYPGQKFSPDNSAKADHNSMTDEMIAQLKQKLKDTNVTPMAYGVVNLPNDEKQSRKVFDFARKLGIKEIVTEPPVEAMPLIDKLAQEYEMTVAIHNHPAPSKYSDCSAVLEAVKDRSDRIGACADIGHWVRSGLSSPECLKKLEGRIISLHVKDIDDQKHDVVWGTGKVDVGACLKELKRQNAKVLMSIEYEKGSGDELVQNVAKSIQYLSDQATKLAGE